MVCTHATLRNGMKEMNNEVFNNCLLAIDEFHHASASADSGLGNIVRDIMTETSAHIIAMTGSYFRGDGDFVLRPEDERRFFPVTYNYYQQLNGCSSQTQKAYACYYQPQIRKGYKIIDELPIMRHFTVKLQSL